MKSLYRRYRPTKLAEVVGQSQVTEPLMKALEQGRINHAYLFIGPRGCGKTSVARILAHEVNGFKYVIEDDYVDIIEIDGASNRGIDNIRELREKAAIAPSIGKYKIYIIDEVHMLTREAFNALLKTLEEPPAHVIFIMATTDAYKVPITITSRAQSFTFNLVNSNVMTAHLKQICKKEDIKIADDALEIVVKRGGGSFRDSLSLLDQISSLSNEAITREMVVRAMGLPQDEIIQSLLNAYASRDFEQIATELKKALDSGIAPETLADEMIAAIIEKPTPDYIPLLTELPNIKAPYAEAKLLVAFAKVSGNNLTTAPGVTSTKQNNQPLMKTTPITPQHQAKRPSAVSQNQTRASITPMTSDAPSGAPAQASIEYPEVASVAPATNGTFDWKTFAQKVQEMNDAVYLQLMKTQHELIGGELHIYPRKRIIRTILARDNNKRILIDAAGGNVKITIHDENDTPSSVEKDETVSKLSAIMGGEVENDGGGNPF
ncbi:DNA polymerase III subunit gamma/tau [Candidatus Saccharibacteria bacterium]|nr:DNA polymerase III subunit gamma/tau [Candidatus Saccharibacteria bacterium]